MFHFCQVIILVAYVIAKIINCFLYYKVDVKLMEKFKFTKFNRKKNNNKFKLQFIIFSSSARILFYFL